MKNITAILLPLFAAAMCLGCGCSESRDGEYGIPEKPGKPSVENRFLNRCDFENVTLTFTPNGPDYSVVTNPEREGLNRSKHCGKVVTAGNKWELIWSEPLPRKLDFTRNAPVFKLKVLAPRAGAKVYFKIEPPQLGESNPKALEVTDVVTTKTGEWEELEFDFTGMAPESNMYQKIVLLFDAGGTSSGEKWYFDDIMCPDDDLTDICLFQRYEGNPVFEPEGPASWRNKHIANAGILSPANSPDGNWWLYCRGSGDVPYYCDQIGLYRQNASDFKPFGPWNEYEGNPVLPVGPVGSFDDGYLLDTAPVVGKDGVIYVYYQGNTTAHNAACLCVRYSTDGIHFTGIDAPLLKKGCSDAVYHDGKYYIYYGGGNPCRLYVSVTEDPLSLANAETYETIPIGGGPSNFDSYAVNGSMVFRLKGVDKWFASYQGSSNSYDFPDRFHVAVSDDLIHWTKIDNDRPLFTRGSRGEWDQGGIWFCEIFEHEDMLYLYYEGWGRRGYVPNRDEPYFSGCSRIGAAYVSKAEFLEWCGIK